MFGPVDGCFERVMTSVIPRKAVNVIDQKTRILRKILLCDITNARGLSHVSFALAKQIVLFVVYFLVLSIPPSI
jgi:hypothetical protein